MMPLKGCLLKHYYPETFYRSMSDMDILVRQEDRAIVKECMEKMGYKTECFGKEGHDVYMKPPVTNIEIHHVLFENVHSVYRNFFQKIRESINGDEPGVYAMSKEDTYLYLLAHLAKHLKNGGAGIRQILDIWLYLQKEEDGFDQSYLRESLKMLELEKFHTTIKELGEYWMHPPEEKSERLEQLTDFVINNGIYGTKENSFTNRVLRADESENLNRKKRRAVWSIFFPAWKDLCTAYPFLKKWPVLFPFVQIKRACKFIFFKSGKDYVRTVANVKEDKAEALKNSMDELGIR